VLLNSHLLSEVELVCDRVVIVDRGRTVAEGTPAELATPGGVEIETASGTRRYPDAGREDVPELVALLVAEGERIYGARLVTGTLEDAYLGLVGESAR
jgi:ABC-2 type transport system ATP-binding protein